MNALIRRLHDERGSTTMFMIVIVVGLLLAVGLVVDGGQKVAAQEQAQSVAEAAARAAAGSVSGTSVSGAAPVINPNTATGAAQSYINAAGLTGTTSISGTTVTVSATASRPTIFLSALGINSLSSTKTATAEIQKR